MSVGVPDEAHLDRLVHDVAGREDENVVPRPVGSDGGGGNGQDVIRFARDDRNGGG